MNESHQTYTRGKKEVIPIQYSDEDIEQQEELDIKAESIEAQLSSKYSEDAVKMFKRLAYELSTIGLSITDACLVLGLDPVKVEQLIEKDAAVKRLIELKSLEYKRGLLKTVSAKAKEDDKLSLLLLQNRFPDEFNIKKGTGGNTDQSADSVRQALTFIQINGDAQPLVKRMKAGRDNIAEEVTMGESSGSRLITKLKDILK